MLPAIRRLLTCISFIVFFTTAQGQVIKPPVQEEKPYKLLTSSKQITIKSSKGIKHIMLWTTGGNRVVEQKDINSSSFVLDIPVNQKTFFLMIGLQDGKVYTEKLAIPWMAEWFDCLMALNWQLNHLTMQQCLLLVLRINHNRNRTVIQQFDLHISTEDPCADPFTEISS